MVRAALSRSPDLQPQGFVPLDWSAPINLGEGRDPMPEGAFIKGLFVDGVLRSCARRGKPLDRQKRYVAFRNYEIGDYLDVCEAAAVALYPNEHPREGLRRVGRMAYPDLLESLIGRVVFGVLGKDIHSITRHVAKAYEIAGGPGRATLIELWEDASVVRLVDVHTYLDTVQVGAFEGAVHACNLDCEVQIKRISSSCAELWTRWWPAVR